MDRKRYEATRNKKQSNVAILISNKIAKLVQRNGEEFFILIKGKKSIKMTFQFLTSISLKQENTGL